MTFVRAVLRWNLRNRPQQRFAHHRCGNASLILILSDINMPGMSGLELLPKAKAMRPDVPIIMITAYGDAETKRQALENGAEALLTKPIDFGALRSEIDSGLNAPHDRAVLVVDDEPDLETLIRQKFGTRLAVVPFSFCSP